jgi:hypothetical protein
MKFDLEIQPITVSLRFVNAGDTIAPSQIPALYVNTKEANITPADFISIDTGSTIDRLLNLNISQATLNNGNFVTESNQILLTHIAKYSKMTGAKYPIFFKHTIKLADGTKLIDQSVRVYNENGDILDQELYMVESGNNEAYIYINPTTDSLLIGEWSDSKAVNRECLKLQPIFADMGSDYGGSNTPLKTYEYYITTSNNEFVCHTGRSGSVFYTAKKDFAFIQKPVGNLNQPWYLLFNNITIKGLDKNANDVYYRLPEYYVQKMEDAQMTPGYDSFYKKYTNQLCKILNNKFIKTQMAPSVYKLGEVDVLIYNKISSALDSAFTTNTLKVGTPSPDPSILWAKIDDYSYDGVFILNKSFDKDSFIAYADYYIDNIYYEFRFLDLNTVQMSKSKMIGLYIAPDYSMTAQSSASTLMFYVFIGDDDGKTYTQKEKRNAVSFVSVVDYKAFIADKSYFHLAFISVENDKMNDIMDISYCADSAEKIFNEQEISKTDLDLVYRSLIERRFSLQMNDTAFSYVSDSVYEDEATSANQQLSINNNDEYMNFVDKTVKENITISTKVITGRSVISSTI